MEDRNDAREGERAPVRNRQMRWQRQHPNRRKAHEKVKFALRRGKLSKQPCQWPGCTETKVDAHHEDYTQPLKVTWLCRKHHIARHRQMRCETCN